LIAGEPPGAGHLLASADVDGQGQDGVAEPPRDVGAQLEALVTGSDTVISAGELRSRLERSAIDGRPLRVKFGVDPSRPDLHLGHAVALRKLRQFQDLGHTAVLIIGDFTGRVGDPSGRSETRPMLTEAAIEANAKTYLDQAGIVLDVGRAEIRHNSEWLGSMSMPDVLRLTSSYTVARMLERDDFRSRYEAGEPISVVEFLYPLMQAMDSVAVRADVEMGGTDQTFNLLVGRDIQRAYDQEPQVVLTMPLLVGTDGRRKMSKSFDNSISLTDPPDEMFGKVMSIPDEQILEYLRLCTDLPAHEIEEVRVRLAQGVNPVGEKRLLARSVVELYAGAAGALAAESSFDRVHRDQQLPEDIDDVALPDEAVVDGTVWICRLLHLIGLATSNSDARRLILQGGVKIDGRTVLDPLEAFEPAELFGRVIQIGRRRFLRVSEPVEGPGSAL
jgi:tyrosyl-tRNA synthetase